MVIIPDLNLTVCRKISQDLKEYRELYKTEYEAFKQKKPLETYHDERYFIDFNKSIEESEELFKGYRKQVINKLCQFKHGDRVAVYGDRGTFLCNTIFKNPYVALADGYVYFNTEASAAGKYNPKRCRVEICRVGVH